MSYRRVNKISMVEWFSGGIVLVFFVIVVIIEAIVVRAKRIWRKIT